MERKSGGKDVRESHQREIRRCSSIKKGLPMPPPLSSERSNLQRMRIIFFECQIRMNHRQIAKGHFVAKSKSFRLVTENLTSRDGDAKPEEGVKNWASKSPESDPRSSFSSSVSVSFHRCTSRRIRNSCKKGGATRRERSLIKFFERLFADRLTGFQYQSRS